MAQRFAATAFIVLALLSLLAATNGSSHATANVISCVDSRALGAAPSSVAGPDLKCSLTKSGKGDNDKLKCPYSYVMPGAGACFGPKTGCKSDFYSKVNCSASAAAQAAQLKITQAAAKRLHTRLCPKVLVGLPNCAKQKTPRAAWLANTCLCDKENLCLETIDGTWWGFTVELVIFVYCFAGLAIVCDDHLVNSLETLCIRWGIKEDVAGATFMAFGSAAPEIIVNAVATLKGQTDLGVGAIIGSGIIAFSLIPGTCGIFGASETPLELKRRPLLRDMCVYTLGLALLVWFFGDGCIDKAESATLFVMYPGYILLIVMAPKMRKEFQIFNTWAASPEELMSGIMHDADAKVHYRLNRTKSFVLMQKEEEEAQEAFEISSFVALMPAPFAAELKRAFGQHVEDAAVTGRVGMVAVQSFEDVLRDMTGRWAMVDPSGAAQTCADLLQDSGNSSPFVDYEEFLEIVARMKKEGAESSGSIGDIASFLFHPLEFAFEWTCPPCEYGEKWEAFYPLTFAISFLWVSFFSYVISAIVTRFVLLSGLPFALFGVVLVAVGAEIPDTIQSVTVARKGYGSMAVANGMGSQICNILVGLGMPWFLSNWVAGKQVEVHGHEHIKYLSVFQFVNVSIAFSVLLGVALCSGADKALLSKEKGQLFVVVYVVMIFGVIIENQTEEEGSIFCNAVCN